MQLKIANLLAFIFMIVMNYLANAIPFNGKTTGQLSAEYPNLFVPAGITFAIWSVIYLLLLLFVIFQFRQNFAEIVHQVGYGLIISSVLNGLWIVAWHYQKLPLSLIIILAMLITLLYVGIRIIPLGNGLTKAAFGIYLGWVTIATIANITAWLVEVSWQGGGVPDYFWTIVLIVVGLGIASFTLIKLNNPFVGLAVAWAFAGIALKRIDDYPNIAWSAIVAGILVLLVLVYQSIRPIQS